MAVDRVPISSIISVVPNFLRSVNLERDFYATDAVGSYITTRASQSALSLLARGKSDPSYRAQCISGPYGSGKSALALFLARLLDIDRGRTMRAAAREDLGEVLDGLLPDEHEGYVTILVSGSRQDLCSALLSGIGRSLRASGKQEILSRLEELHGTPIDMARPDAGLLARVFEDLARLAVEVGHALGVVVFVDELGKLLEYAALYPGASDIHILQELAEAASRSNAYPLWFITILHQQFSEYAFRLGRRRQTEWAKVQQRFYDCPCLLDTADAMTLMSRTLSGKDVLDERSKLRIRQVARECARLSGRAAGAELEEVAVTCYPLHPASLIVLPALFRRFGQNERSLFSFFSADEPFSLFDWASRHEFNSEAPPLLRLTDVYDYVRHTLAAGAALPQLARICAQADDTIARLGDAPSSHVDVIKTIVLLNALGEASPISASEDVVSLAVSSESLSISEVHEVLRSLVSRRLIVFRRFRRAFALWDGSDIDIDQKLADACQGVRDDSLAVSVARRLCPPRPLVARRHSFVTGIPRSFAVVASSVDSLSETLQLAGTNDGLLVHCLARDEEQVQRAINIIRELNDPAIVVVVGRETDELAESAIEVTALDRVWANTPELSGDRVARRELGNRQLDAETAFRAEWDAVFAPGRESAIWLWRGDIQEVSKGRDLMALLSSALDAKFHYAPKLKNELINRTRPSSAAIAARGRLIRAMIESPELAGLGICGYPPERSIYESLFRQSRIHRPSEYGKWCFGAPNGDDDGLRAAWDLITDRTCSEALEPVRVDKLVEELGGPPYGVAMGFAPLLVIAYVIANSDTMAIYSDDGTFVPNLTAAIGDLLARRPERFSLLRFTVGGDRQRVVERFAKGFGVSYGVVSVISSLYSRMAALPDYVRKARNLSPETIAVRDEIYRAKSPESLLFVDLPKALDLPPFRSSGEAADRSQPDRVDEFFTRLNQAFQDLMDCYPGLLRRIARSLTVMFDVPESYHAWRRVIEKRAARLCSRVSTTELQRFLSRARDGGLEDYEYLESVGFSVVGQHPKTWGPTDEDDFFRKVGELAIMMSAAESQDDLHSLLEPGEDGYSLSVTSRAGHTRQIIRLQEPEKERVYALVDEILRSGRRLEDQRLILAAIAECGRRLMGSAKAGRGEASGAEGVGSDE